MILIKVTSKHAAEKRVSLEFAIRAYEYLNGEIEKKVRDIK